METKYISAIALIALIVGVIGIVYTSIVVSNLSNDVADIKSTVDTVLMAKYTEWEREMYIAAVQGGEKVSFYSSYSQVVGQQLCAAFEDKFPGIPTEHYRGPPATIMGKLQEEISAGVLVCDVVLLSYGGWVPELIDGGHIMEFEPPEIENYPEDYLVGTPYHYPAVILPQIFLCNNLLVSEEDISTVVTWSDLADPRFGNYTWAMGDWKTTQSPRLWFYVMNRTFGMDVINDIADNMKKGGLLIFTSHGAVTDCLTRGEAVIVPYMTMTTPADAILKGAPLTLKALNPMPGTWDEAMIMKDTKNPNAAKLFENFMLSKEGQTILGPEGGSISFRSDVAFPSVPGLPPREQCEIFLYDWDDVLAKEADIIDTLESLLRG